MKNSLRISRIAYVISRYPCVSHTFITREIKELRQQQLQVQTYSVNNPQGPFSHDSDEAQDLKTVVILKQQLLVRLFLSILRLNFQLFKMFRRGLHYIHSGPGSLWQKLGHCVEAVILADSLQRRHIEHIHVHFVNNAASIAELASLITNLPWSISVHGPDSMEDVTRYDFAHKMKSASSIRAISHYCRQQILRHGGIEVDSKIKIVRCGVELPEVSQKSKAENVLSGLTVGRCVSAKGHDFLLLALAKCKNQGLKFTWTFIGDGPERVRFEKLSAELGLSDRVRFKGSQNRTQVQAALLESDLFVLASLAEGLPVSLMEAMAQYLPVISTRTNGIPELIQHQVNGLLCYPADVDSLSHAITRLIQEPMLRSLLSLNSRETIKERYNIKLNGLHMAYFFNPIISDEKRKVA
jgi:colanic acid/amylovoran biosynthesis glycosyltransferase